LLKKQTIIGLALSHHTGAELEAYLRIFKDVNKSYKFR